MLYTPENNPYIPGDPYSYDLKWMVGDIKHMEERFGELDSQVQEATDQADRAEDEADRAGEAADNSEAEALVSEGYAKGTQNGEAVTEGTYYHNNSKYYSDQSASSAQASANSAADAADYAAHIADPVAGIVTSWLDTHVDPDTGYVIDNTLTIASAAADAKAAGDRITAVATDLSDYEDETDSILKKSIVSNFTGDETVSFIAEGEITDLTLSAISSPVGNYDGMIVLDGSVDENWSLHSSGRFYASGLGITLTLGIAHVASYMICSNSISPTIKYFSVGSSGIYISPTDDYPTVADLETYLSTHPLTVWYKSGSYATATQFYQCVQIFDGTVSSAAAFIATYGTDQKFPALDRTDNVDFINGSATINNVAYSFTPVAIAQGLTGTKLLKSDGNVIFGTKTVPGQTLDVTVEKLAEKVVSPNLNGYADHWITDMICSQVNGYNMDDQINTNEIVRITGAGTMHDSTVVVHNGIAYVVYCHDPNGISDAANSPSATVVFAAYNISTRTEIFKTVIAKKDDISGGYTQTGGAGSPNLYLIGDVAHILYTANINNTYMEMHNSYDISTGTYSGFEPITINGNVVDNSEINSIFDFSYASTDYTYTQMNASIAYTGTTYFATIVAGNGNKGKCALLSTENFIDWRFTSYIEVDGVTPIYEVPCGYLNPGFLYMMIRPGTAPNGALIRYSISTKTIDRTVMLPNSGSRPAFFNYNGELYFFNNSKSRAWGDIGIINGDIGLSGYIAQGEGGYNYPSFFTYNNEVYVSRTNGGIQISKFTPSAISRNSIINKLMQLFG